MISEFKSKSLWSAVLCAAVMIVTASICLPDQVKPEKCKAETAKQKALTGINKKLQEIVFDHIEFEEATIPIVIKYLVTKSRELDPEKQGVDIVLQLKEEELDNLPTITMSVDDIPLGEAKKYICMAGGIEYTIEEKAVIITLKPSKLPENSP